MAQETTTPILSERFDEALTYVADLHRTQLRKGGDIPYLGHLLSVSSLVIEGGGTETQAIAGLLHDAVEDQGGPPVILVSLADKLDNARAILRDHRLHNDQLWQRFSVHDPKEHLWYYKSLLEVFKQRNQTWLVDELDRVVTTLEESITQTTGA